MCINFTGGVDFASVGNTHMGISNAFETQNTWVLDDEEKNGAGTRGDFITEGIFKYKKTWFFVILRVLSISLTSRNQTKG